MTVQVGSVCAIAQSMEAVDITRTITALMEKGKTMSDYEYGKCSSCEYEKKPKDELPCRVCTYSCCKWTRKSTDKLERAIGYLHEIGWMQEHDKALTENAVPVVRCKDCKWSDVYQVDSNFQMERWCDGGFIPKSVQDYDYCSWGERKDDE